MELDARIRKPLKLMILVLPTQSILFLFHVVMGHIPPEAGIAAATPLLVFTLFWLTFRYEANRSRLGLIKILQD